ncbi:kelch repeat-containing protein, partial [Planctomycetota bacterium]
ASVSEQIAAIKDRIERSICHPGVTMFVDSDSKVYEPKAGSWQDVDVSADQDIPFGATGLVLEIVNTDPEKDHTGHTRPVGGTDDRPDYTKIWRHAQIVAFVKLNEKKMFQAYRSDKAIRFFVRGYTGKDVVFFDSPINKGRVKGGYGDWDAKYDMSLAGDGVPPVSLAIFDIATMGGESGIATRLPDGTGAVHWTSTEPKTHMHVLVPVGRKSDLQIRNPGMGTNNGEHYLVGYIKNIGVWLPKQTPTIMEKGGGWETADLSKIVPEDAGVVMLRAAPGWDTTWRQCDVRMAGSKDDQFEHSHHVYHGGGGRSTSGMFMMVGLDKKRRIEYKSSGAGRGEGTAGLRLHVVGYLRRTSPGDAKLGKDPSGKSEAGKAGKVLKGVWRKIGVKYAAADGKEHKPMFRRRCPGAVYDVSRGKCILYGSSVGGNINRNDVWAYSSANGTWTCMLENDLEADGITRPKAHQWGDKAGTITYDSSRDCYWLLDERKGLWSLDPDNWKWKKSFDLQIKGGVVALGYSPKVDRLVFLQSYMGGLSNPRLIELRKGTVQEMKKNPMPGRQAYSVTCCSPGGFDAGADGKFLVFGGSTRNDTWLYDPSSDEWAESKATKAPSARSDSLLAYSRRMGGWVLFGGRTMDKKDLSDVWFYNPTADSWSEIEVGETPAWVWGRSALWYDSIRDTAVLYSDGETWHLKIGK